MIPTFVYIAGLVAVLLAFLRELVLFIIDILEDAS